MSVWYGRSGRRSSPEGPGKGEDQVLTFESEWINRVASICKNDIGGDMETILERVFMSFAKIQISCSNSKSTKFSFDRLVSVRELFYELKNKNHKMNF